MPSLSNRLESTYFRSSHRGMTVVGNAALPSRRRSDLNRFGFYLGMLVMLIGLGSCGNQVITDKPLYAKAGDANSVRLRDGIWIGGDNCRQLHNGTLSGHDCQGVFRIAGRRLDFIVEEPGSRHPNPSFRYQIADGGILVAQARLLVEPGEAARSREMADLRRNPKYLYVGLRPLSKDERGQITAVKAWILQCGVPGPIERRYSDSVIRRPVAGTLLPGVTMVGDNCTVDGATTLFALARAGENWEGAMMVKWHFPHLEQFVKAQQGRGQP